MNVFESLKLFSCHVEASLYDIFGGHVGRCRAVYESIRVDEGRRDFQRVQTTVVSVFRLDFAIFGRLQTSESIAECIMFQRATLKCGNNFKKRNESTNKYSN